MFRSSAVSLTFLLLLTALCISGCSKDVSVTGKVTFPDGSPLETGSIIFESGTFQGFSTISKDGYYSLGSIKEGDRIPNGHYRIRVLASSGGGSDGLPLVNYVAAKYANTETSGLECEVNGTTVFNVIVEKPLK